MMLLTSTLIAPLAYSQDDIDEIMAREITEGKILAAENMMIEDLHKEIASRQEKASQLIALVARFANDRMSDENAKEEAQYALSGFIARLQNIREDQEALNRKEIQPDLETLQKTNRRLESLISDLKSYLK